MGEQRLDLGGKEKGAATGGEKQRFYPKAVTRKKDLLGCLIVYGKGENAV